MKVLEPHQPETDEHLDADALIEEARQRHRKRRLFIGIIVLIVAVGTGIWAASGGKSATKPPSSRFVTMVTPTEPVLWNQPSSEPSSDESRPRAASRAATAPCNR